MQLHCRGRRERVSLTDFARVWVWVGVAVWAVVFAAMVGRGVRLVRGEHPPPDSRQIAEVAPSRE